MGTIKFCEYTGLQLSKVAGRNAVKVPDHPKASSNGYVLRYRYLMEQKLGRYLESWEEVHHRDENELNDAIENLEVMTTQEHTRHHRRYTLDYVSIKKFRSEGLGYKRIAKKLNYSVSSVRTAVKIIERDNK